ncbi:MAG: (Fe-S)-binding protein [Chloroflexi bacterium]|nr:(Fe-S)-binding protein [Chloroflexota bacterium]
MPLSEEIAIALRKCNRCGFCQAGCPIYKVTGVEWETARGRIELVRSALLDHNLELKDIDDPVFHCLTCNNCVEHCPAGIQTADIIFGAREEIRRRQGNSWIQKMLFRKLLPNPSLLHSASRLLRLADVTGLRSAARKTGLTRLIGDAGKAEAIVPPAPSSEGLAAIARQVKKIENPKHKVAYFVGCHAANLSPAVAAATIRILHKHRVDVVVPEFVCCGLPAAGYGDADSARELARKNIDTARALDVEAIVTPCGSCSSYLKEYGKLFADENEWPEKAADFAGKVKDLSEFLVDIGLNTEMSTVRKKVTYHDPCHLAHFQKIREQPRTIIKNIPGVEFVEMAESNMCCGAAGSYAFNHYDLSMKVLERKMDNLAKTSADILVTNCPGCVMQLAYGAKKHGLPTRTTELVELLDLAYHTGDDEP